MINPYFLGVLIVAFIFMVVSGFNTKVMAAMTLPIVACYFGCSFFGKQKKEEKE